MLAQFPPYLFVFLHSQEYINNWICMLSSSGLWVAMKSHLEPWWPYISPHTKCILGTTSWLNMKSTFTSRYVALWRLSAVPVSSVSDSEDFAWSSFCLWSHLLNGMHCICMCVSVKTLFSHFWRNLESKISRDQFRWDNIHAFRS